MKPRDLGLSAASAFLAATAVVAVFAAGDRFGRTSEPPREAQANPAAGAARAPGSADESPARGSEVLAGEISELNRRLYAIEREKAKL